jgi:hypothetical protein
MGSSPRLRGTVRVGGRIAAFEPDLVRPQAAGFVSSFIGPPLAEMSAFAIQPSMPSG